MRLFLHEFPSTEGICWETKAGIYVIRFDHWEAKYNVTYTFNITFKWCDVRVNVQEIKILDRFLTKVEDDLLLFREPIIPLLGLFHKYDNFFWKPSAQIPRQLIKDIFAIVISLADEF